MTSLMKQIFETMPMKGALVGVDVGSTVGIDLVSPSDLMPFLRYVPKGAKPSPVVTTRAKNLPPDQEKRAPLWSMSFPDDPARVDDISCDVREHGFAELRVLDSVRFGYEDPPAGGVGSGTYRPAIRIRTVGGARIELPLLDAFLYQTWQVFDGGIVPGSSALFALATIHDTGILRVFVYDFTFTPGTGTLNGPTPLTAASPLEAEDLKRIEAACSRLSIDSGDDEPGVLTEMFNDHLLQAIPQLDLSQGIFAAVGNLTQVVTVKVRVVVAVSFLGCKETCDFQPTGGVGGAQGVAGVARMFPHILVTTNVPFAFDQIETSIQLDRPARTSNTHCLGCAEMDDEIEPMLVTDTNKKEVFVSAGTGGAAALPLPAWSDLFSYYKTQAFDWRPNTAFHVVRTDRPNARSREATVLRAPPGIPLGFKAASLAIPTHKLPHQGEFDNVHLAPTMKCVDVVAIAGETVSVGPESPLSAEMIRKVDPASTGLTKIGMAPFCAHDCFHMHWRWGDGADPAQYGWSRRGPSSAAGAPMVPKPQDVWIWLRAKRSLTYHAVHTEAVGGGPLGDKPAGISPLSWVPFCHHGAAYVVFGSTTIIAVTRFGVEALSQATLATQVDPPRYLLPTKSWAAFYWWMRYGVDPETLEPYERTQGDMDAARLL